MHPFFPKLPSHPGCYITLSSVPVLYSRELLVILLKYSSVCKLIPNSLTIPSPQPPPPAVVSSFSKSVSLFLFCKSVQSLSCVWFFATPWTAAHQASLSITNSWSLLKLMSIESVMPSNHLILCCPLLLPPSIFPSIRVFSNESVLHTGWPKFIYFLSF